MTHILGKPYVTNLTWVGLNNVLNHKVTRLLGWLLYPHMSRHTHVVGIVSLLKFIFL